MAKSDRKRDRKDHTAHHHCQPERCDQVAAPPVLHPGTSAVQHTQLALCAPPPIVVFAESAPTAGTGRRLPAPEAEVAEIAICRAALFLAANRRSKWGREVPEW